jgi:hypothetical protein
MRVGGGLLCTLAIQLALGGAALAETFRDGLRAYNIGDYAAAHAIWLPLARAGDAQSQASLAYLYLEGNGVPRDSRQAAQWYQRAATQGEPTAQSFLCQMHMRGDGVERNLELALLWCELSLEGGVSRGLHPRERILEQMTAQRRQAAAERVARWKEQLRSPDRATRPLQ